MIKPLLDWENFAVKTILQSRPTTKIGGEGGRGISQGFSPSVRNPVYNNVTLAHCVHSPVQTFSLVGRGQTMCKMFR